MKTLSWTPTVLSGLPRFDGWEEIETRRRLFVSADDEGLLGLFTHLDSF
jgi:hypothetical protein